MDIETIKNKPIKLKSKLSTAITYLVIGLIFTSYTLNIGYIRNFQFIASAVCFYLGMRLIKNLNNSFKCAYFISIYLLISITILNLLKITSPIYIFDDYIFISTILDIIFMFSIAIGLNQYVQKHYNISFISFYIFAQFFAYLFHGDNVDITVFILFCIILFLCIRSLWKCRREIKASDNDLVLKSPKIQSSVFIGSWIVLTVVLSICLPYTWPFFTYDYILAMDEPSYKYIVDQSTHFEKLDNVTVYETNDNQYRIIAEYQEKETQGRYSFMDIQYIANGSSGGYLAYEPCYVSVSDEKGFLKSQDVILELPFGFFHDAADARPQRVYLNPLSKNLKITIVFTVNKAELTPIEDEEGNVLNSYVSGSINIHRYKYGSFPNNPETVFDNFSINKDGKLARNQENDIQ